MKIKSDTSRSFFMRSKKKLLFKFRIRNSFGIYPLPKNSIGGGLAFLLN